MADEPAISPAPRPRQPKGERNDEAIKNALELRALGFTILPVKTFDKAPASQNWEAATQNDPEVFLNNPGTRNYGVLPPPGCVTLDWDDQGEVAAQEVITSLGIDWPDTRSHFTPRGMHFTVRWPDDLPRPKGPWFGKLIARWPMGDPGKGYVVGPGSVVKYDDGTLGTYHVAHPGPIALVPRAFAEAALAHETKPHVNGHGEGIITIAPGPQLPETVQQGGRHEYILKAARYLRGLGLDREAIFAAVWPMNLKFPQPKTEAEVWRAIGDVEQFPIDPVPLTAEEVVAAAPNLIVSQRDYHAANSAAPEWVSPLAAYGLVTMVSGPPKAGKSTFISGLMQAREDGSVFLWGDPVPKGPMLLVTEEGGFPVVRKTVGLSSLFILDRMAFVVAGLKSLDHLLVALGAWTQPLESPALVIIDTLAVWGDIKDENDSMLATKAIVALKVWAQVSGAAVVLVHHTRKGGGEHGEAIRGGSGIFAAVDQSAELGFGLDPKSDNRTLTTVGRIDFGESKRLSFDRDTQTYSLDMAPLPDSLDLDQFPEDGYGHDGLTREDAQKLWGVGQASANAKLKELVDAGRLVTKAVRLDGERVTRKVYWRPRPLLDVRSVGERMADIHSGTGERE